MKKTLKRLAAVTLSAMVLVTGCGGQNSDSSKNQNKNPNILNVDNLDEGVYYIQRGGVGNDLSKLYFGTGTFDQGNISNSASDSRVLWYKTNFDNIPTLYSGDSLIFYTRKDIDEKFVFERFEDEGYSIGICQMSVTPTGRYSISTDSNGKNTYPNGDTDMILQLGSDDNKRVILDSLGGLQIRTVKNAQDGANYSYLSRHGTIIGLEKDKSYEAKVFAGTVEHDYVFTADVRVLGSMDAYESYDYSFKQEYVLDIKIPEWFNSGYYLINGYGIFRYVKDATAYDDNTDFNVQNINPDEKNTNSSSSSSINSSISTQSYASTSVSGQNTKAQTVSSKNEGTDPGLEDTEGNYQRSTFVVETPGRVTVTATAINPTGSAGTSYPQIIGSVAAPSGASFEMYYNGTNAVVTAFNATETGTYTVSIGNLHGRSADVVIS